MRSLLELIEFCFFEQQGPEMLTVEDTAAKCYGKNQLTQKRIEVSGFAVFERSQNALIK